jgi:hypothetical protein
MSPNFPFLVGPAAKPNTKSQSPIDAAPHQATRETNSAQETRLRVWAPPKAEDHGRTRDHAKQIRPIRGRNWLVDEIVSV